MRLDLTTANVVVAILIVGNDKQQCARAFLVLDQPACILVAIWSTGVLRLNTLTACPHTFRFCKSDHWHRFANGVLNGWSVFAFIFHFFAWPCFISVRVCRPGARRVSNVAACVLEREVLPTVLSRVRQTCGMPWYVAVIVAVVVSGVLLWSVPITKATQNLDCRLSANRLRLFVLRSRLALWFCSIMNGYTWLSSEC